MKAIILAAGKGTRMGAESKPLVEIEGETMIQRIIKTLLETGFTSKDILVVVGHKKEMVMAECQGYVQFVEQTELDGTGGAMRVAIQEIDDADVIVLNADTPFITTESLRKLIVAGVLGQYQVILLGAKASYEGGRIIQEDGKYKIVEGSVEGTDFNSGVYYFKTDWLKESVRLLERDQKSNEYRITDLIERAAFVNVIYIDAKEAQGFNSLL